MHVRFGVPQLVQILYNEHYEKGRVVSSFIKNNVIWHSVELIDTKFHIAPKYCTIITIQDSDDKLKDIDE